MSTDGALKRIIRMMLDKAAMEEVRHGLHGLADSTEEKWKKTMERIAEFIAVAFVTEKVIEFGKESIKLAGESEAAWRDLQTSIENTGTSFEGLNEKLHATAEAFQDATIHDRDQFASSLSRLITLTGDTTASLNNMGLVANVAAKFFKGDLEPASNLVAKAMNGNVMMLQRLGIHAKDAQSALEILAQRSMGAAEHEAGTFNGQLTQLHNSWDDVLKDLGEAIIHSGGATDALTVLRGAVKTLGDWIHDNKENIRDWVANGVVFAIDATDVLIRAFQLVGYTITGTFQLSLGIGALALGKLAQAYATVQEASIGARLALGKTVSQYELSETIKIQKQADAIVEWGNAVKDAGDKSGKAAEKALFVPLFSSDQFKGKPREAPKTPGEDNTPMVGKNLSDKDSKEVENAIKKFQEAEKSAADMERMLGDRFDGVGKEIERTTTLFDVLVGKGIDPAKVGFAGLGERLTDLILHIKPVTEANKELAHQMGAELASAALSQATGLDTATSALDSLKARQALILTQFKKLKTEGIDENSAAMVDLRQQYLAYSDAIENMRPIQALIDANKALATSMSQNIALAAADGMSALELLKKQEQELVKVIDTAVLAKVDQQSEGFKNLQIQLRAVRESLAEVTDLDRQAKALQDFGNAMRRDLFKASVDGATALDKLVIEQKNLGKAIDQYGIPKTASQRRELEELKKRYEDVTGAIKEQTIAMQFQTTIADFLADALGSALQGGIAKAAATKAKQNAIEAAEMLVRAGVYALFGDAPHATAAAVAAGQFAVLAAGWGVLSASLGGGGGSSPVSVSATPSATGTTSGSSDLTSSRASASSSASQAVSPTADVSIYMVGPGFDALNPAVQRVVWGAQREAEQRYGPNARIRIRNSGDGQ